VLDIAFYMTTTRLLLCWFVVTRIVDYTLFICWWYGIVACRYLFWYCCCWFPLALHLLMMLMIVLLLSVGELLSGDPDCCCWLLGYCCCCWCPILGRYCSFDVLFVTLWCCYCCWHCTLICYCWWLRPTLVRCYLVVVVVVVVDWLVLLLLLRWLLRWGCCCLLVTVVGPVICEQTPGMFRLMCAFPTLHLLILVVLFWSSIVVVGNVAGVDCGDIDHVVVLLVLICYWTGIYTAILFLHCAFNLTPDINVTWGYRSHTIGHWYVGTLLIPAYGDLLLINCPPLTLIWLLIYYPICDPGVAHWLSSRCSCCCVDRALTFIQALLWLLLTFSIDCCVVGTDCWIVTWLVLIVVDTCYALLLLIIDIVAVLCWLIITLLNYVPIVDYVQRCWLLLLIC